MEDFKDEMSHKGKKYYLSHVEWVYKDTSPLFKMFGNDRQKMTQLVCASDIEEAKKAVEDALMKSNGEDIVIIKNRIDHPIVGN